MLTNCHYWVAVAHLLSLYNQAALIVLTGWSQWAISVDRFGRLAHLPITRLQKEGLAEDRNESSYALRKPLRLGVRCPEEKFRGIADLRAAGDPVRIG